MFGGQEFEDVPDGTKDYTDWEGQIFHNSTAAEPAATGGEEARKKANNTELDVDSLFGLDMPTSGQEALEIIGRQAPALQDVTIQAIDKLYACVPLRESDRAAMASFKGRLTGCTHLFSIWEKENDFRSAARTFHDEMQLAAGNRCRSLMNQFISYVINEKRASIELATKCVVHYAIGKARSMGTREARVQMPQAMRIIKFWFHYMDTSNLKYGVSCVDGVTDEGFRSRCKKKKLPTLQRGQKLDFDPPGAERLRMTQNRVKVWAMAFEDMVNSIAGPEIASGINVREEKLKFYIPADVTKDHNLRQKAYADGSLQDMDDLISLHVEERDVLALLGRTIAVPEIEPANLEAVSNLIRALHPDMKVEWDWVLLNSPSVHEGLEYLDDRVPIISWEMLEVFADEAEMRCRRNTAKKIERKKAFANSMQQKQPKQDKQQQPRNEKRDGDKTNNRSPAGQAKQRPCRVCKEKYPDNGKEMGHSTKDCPNREGKLCRFWQRDGHCQFGDECRDEHPTGGSVAINEADAKKAANAKKEEAAKAENKPAALAAAAEGNPDESTNKVTREWIEQNPNKNPDHAVNIACRNKSDKKCESTFDTIPNTWLKRNLNVPRSCYHCRHNNDPVDQPQRQQHQQFGTESSLMIAESGESDEDLDFDDAFNDFGFVLVVADNEESQGTSTSTASHSTPNQLIRRELDVYEAEVAEEECKRVILEEIAVITDWVSAMESHLDLEEDDFSSLCCEVAAGSTQSGEEVCCSQAVEQLEPDISDCSSVRDPLTTTGCAVEFDLNGTATTGCDVSNAELYFRSGGRPRK